MVEIEEFLLVFLGATIGFFLDAVFGISQRIAGWVSGRSFR